MQKNWDHSGRLEKKYLLQRFLQHLKMDFLVNLPNAPIDESYLKFTSLLNALSI